MAINLFHQPVIFLKIEKRFIKHLLFGFGLWILLLGIIVPIVIEIILPKLGLGDERYEWLVLIFICMVTIVCLLLFGWYFGRPILIIMKWINQLAYGNHSRFREYEQMHTRQGKFKIRYRIYQEVFTHLENMRLQLEKAKVERAQVELAKLDWMAGISHDLKTPLTYIKGYSTLLLNVEYDWSNKEQHKFIQEIHDKGTHMEQLVQDLGLAIRFDGSQKIPIHRSPQNIVKFIQLILADMSNELRAQQHHFELQTSTEDIRFAFDAHLLNRALINIYMNSILHNKEFTNILTQINQNKQHVIIHIQDDGNGMTEETKQNIFNRYYRGTTTDQPSEGTGLGMAIVKQIIEAHDGSIRVESELHKGTTFTITLPKSS